MHIDKQKPENDESGKFLPLVAMSCHENISVQILVSELAKTKNSNVKTTTNV